MTAADLLGQRVTAKRLGWDESLTAEDELDLEPRGDGDGDDLEGVLEIASATTEEIGTTTTYLVDGQEADPDTVEAA